MSRGESALTGGDGNDTLEEIDGVDQGGETLVGSNLLYGGSGDDKILVRFGASAVSAGGGNDVIRAKNDVRDIINCGADQDTVTFDQGLDDVENNCEEQNS